MTNPDNLEQFDGMQCDYGDGHVKADSCKSLSL